MFGANTFDANRVCVWSATGELVCPSAAKPAAVQRQGASSGNNNIEHFACLATYRSCDKRLGYPDSDSNIKTPCNGCESSTYSNERCSCACKNKILNNMWNSNCWQYKLGRKVVGMYDTGKKNNSTTFASCTKIGPWSATSYCKTEEDLMKKCDINNTVNGVRIADATKCKDAGGSPLPYP